LKTINYELLINSKTFITKQPYSIWVSCIYCGVGCRGLC